GPFLTSLVVWLRNPSRPPGCPFTSQCALEGTKGTGKGDFFEDLSGGNQWACNARPKAPSTNIQAPEKHQEPSSKTGTLRVWSLKFDASLAFAEPEGLARKPHPLHW